MTESDWHEEDPVAPRTTVLNDASRTVITRNQSPDIPFDRSINPYRGCEHGCIYCFARPTHAWLGLSPGLDFETQILIKPDAPAILDSELRKPSYKVAPIAMGTNTDPYQPLERSRRVTREILEVLNGFNHPVTIVTKSALVTRDIDILADMASRNLAKVAISVTTLDRRLARVMEPRASSPRKRLDAIRALSEAGVPTGALVAPVIPALNDSEIEAIVREVARHGASELGAILLRLPLEIHQLFEEWLQEHFPVRAERVMSLVLQTRGGEVYRAEWGKRLRGEGPVADMIFARVSAARRKHGLDLAQRDPGKYRLDCSAFQPPPKKGDQISLF